MKGGLITMELLSRGKNIYGNSKTKKEMIECLHYHIDWIKQIPDDAEITNQEDDYMFFHAEPKDKDDRKYLKTHGFYREERE